MAALEEILVSTPGALVTMAALAQMDLQCTYSVNKVPNADADSSGDACSLHTL